MTERKPSLLQRLRRALSGASSLSVPVKGTVAELAARAERTRPLVEVETVERELSGPAWCARFPGDDTTASLVQPFRRHLQLFIGSLEASRIHVRITATHRPVERAYLMKGAWDIWKHLVSPEKVPAWPGVAINWVHATPGASWAAARDMAGPGGFGLVHRPSLDSRHIQGRAVDMNVTSWEGRTVVDGAGAEVTLERIEDLYQLGASYSVHKLLSDRPHWSDDGH